MVERNPYDLMVGIEEYLQENQQILDDAIDAAETPLEAVMLQHELQQETLRYLVVAVDEWLNEFEGEVYDELEATDNG